MFKLFLDLDGTLAKFNVKNALKRFDNEIGFFANLGAYKNIEVINKMAKNGNVFIISASPNNQADNDKITWIKKYLPNVKDENITLCRLGENKAKVIENKYKMKIDKSCLLLDDYTKNLNEWVSFGGIGIKRLTSVADNKSKKWTGKTLRNLNQITTIVSKV